MKSVLAIGSGAGLASALLFAVVITGSPLGVLLSYVAPLPVLIAALGWNHRSGLVAALVGGIAIALALRFEAGLAFVVGSALPAWWIAYLTLLGRPEGDGRIEWYPLGRLLMWIALTSALITFIGVLALGGGDYDAYRTGLKDALEGVLRLRTEVRGTTGPDASRDALIDVLAAVVPFLAAVVYGLVLSLNVWIAARVVAISEHLPRPFPYIPATAMPPITLLVFGGALVGLVLLPGFAGIAALCVVGGLAIGFALQGLALVHDLSSGRPNRAFLLAITYLLVVFFGHTVLPLLALAGMADAGLGLRHRFRPGGSGPRPFV